MTGIPETEVAARLKVSRQTLRNWRMGYLSAGIEYEPKLTRDVHWKKIGNTVLYNETWVAKMQEAKNEVDQLFEGINQ